MGDISINFSRSEFRCKCGKCSNYDTVDVELIALCEEVREINGNRPLRVTSGHRCPEHNKNVGGANNSLHLFGRAADLRVHDPKEVYEELVKRYPDKYSFAVYNTFLHIDTRSTKPWRRPNA